MRVLQSIEELSEVWKAPVLVIFKHSTRCPVSAAAYQEVDQFATLHPDVPVLLVKVIEQRRASGEVERRTAVRHESPQVLLVKGGVTVWHESHWRITADSLAGIVSSLNGG